MPDKTTEAIAVFASIYQSVMLAFVGVMLSIGKHLSQRQPWEWPVVIGRAICSGGIAMSAGAVLVWVPDLPMIGQIGIAAALASIGVSGVEQLLARIVGGR